MHLHAKYHDKKHKGRFEIDGRNYFVRNAADQTFTAERICFQQTKPTKPFSMIICLLWESESYVILDLYNS